MSTTPQVLVSARVSEGGSVHPAQRETGIGRRGERAETEMRGSGKREAGGITKRRMA